MEKHITFVGPLAARTPGLVSIAVGMVLGLTLHPSAARAIDTDNDGMPDAYEFAHWCLDYQTYDSVVDQDHDGASSYSEYVIGTDPCDPDTDNDGITDGYEINNFCLFPLTDDASADPDDDGADNLTEFLLQTYACYA
ncbi:MAG: hypothetical protein HY718_10500, partial [Planctomycetes bacterium]|nr:hypothetical protein [Planctomycetota bacterium]